MKILAVYPEVNIDKNQLSKLNEIGETNLRDATNLDSDEFINIAKGFEAIITVPTVVNGGLNKEVLSKLPNLKIISLVTVGYSGIDLNFAKENGILICNAKGSNSEAVAQHIWGMILDLSKKISQADRDVRKTQQKSFLPYEGIELLGKTIGIIGVGDIGKKVARISNAFDMSVLGVNKSGNRVEGVKITSVEDLFHNSDVVVVSVPLNNDTKDMISTDEFSIMKKGSILINCARSEIVNKAAVLEALNNKTLFGYGLDKNLMSEMDKDDPYLIHENILITPHTGFFTKESNYRCVEYAMENIISFIENSPIRVINL